ncbi:hypothetical protein LH464_21500 [Neorhizobium sp. T786]|uniref:hypothetical protein n=1 Tax=Pseudorhizobium xiangyangii TaxID=2883104 RepID=UPI001CFFF7D3|nr:hypothetical protein [Neorhizobium xiangyangii]MCB5205045.1 hypothetical protein [Neorhizobium xiangyangii]
MADCCPMNAFAETCEDGVCKSKAQPLGRFAKSSDMTGVFTPGFRHILTVAIGMGAIAAAVFVPVYLNKHYAGQDRANQEHIHASR